MQKKDQDVGAHLVVRIVQMIADDSGIERRAIQLAADAFRELESTLNQFMGGLHWGRSLSFFRRFYRGQQFAGVLPPVRWPFLQAFHYRGGQLRRNLRSVVRNWIGWLRQMRRYHLLGRCGRKWQTAR